MARYARLTVDDGQINEALGRLVADLLTKQVVQAVLVPARQPYGNGVMQTLISDPAEARNVDPLAPVVPVSSATMLARLTRREASMSIAAFLRPCEVRAVLELVKLKQASLDHVLLIGMDCHGRYATRDYISAMGQSRQSTLEFLEAVSSGRGTELSPGVDVVSACRACRTPVPENVDLRLQLFGFKAGEAFGLESLTPIGDDAVQALALFEDRVPAGREETVAQRVGQREQFREGLRKETSQRVGSIDGLLEVIASCVNCYNCRVACPVCYCRECVFVTDTFSHDSRQYQGWVEKRGRLRMPTDTLFYHLTRMAHMSTLCVECGQCTTACPNDIPVAEVFAMVGDGAQAVFGYEPGRDVGEAQPLATFVENELMQVTGQTK